MAGRAWEALRLPVSVCAGLSTRVRFASSIDSEMADSSLQTELHHDSVKRNTLSV